MHHVLHGGRIHQGDCSPLLMCQDFFQILRNNTQGNFQVFAGLGPADLREAGVRRVGLCLCRQ